MTRLFHVTIRRVLTLAQLSLTGMQESPGQASGTVGVTLGIIGDRAL